MIINSILKKLSTTYLNFLPKSLDKYLLECYNKNVPERYHFDIISHKILDNDQVLWYNKYIRSSCYRGWICDDCP